MLLLSSVIISIINTIMKAIINFDQREVKPRRLTLKARKLASVRGRQRERERERRTERTERHTRGTRDGAEEGGMG